MLRSLLAVGLILFTFVCSHGVTANDKDNGFPFATASGMWVAENGMVVSVKVLPSRNLNQATVRITLADSRGNVVAKGELISSTDVKSAILVPMVQADGERFYLEAAAVYSDGDVVDYRLQFKFFKSRKSSRSFLNIVLDRWVGTKH